MRARARFSCCLGFAILVALFIQSRASAQSVVCPRERIEGCDIEYNRAKSLLPSVTYSEEASVYITKQGDSLYVHSNFRPSFGFAHPIKILTNETKNLELLTSNILTAAGQADIAFDISRAHRESIRYLIDQKVFDSSGKMDLDIMGAKNVHVVFENDKIPRKLSKVPSARGPPKWIAEWNSDIYIRVNRVSRPHALFSSMEARSFRKDDFRFVSLFLDKSVENAIEASSLRAREFRLATLSREALEQAFSSSRKKILGLLGHVEDGDFVTRTSDGRKELIRVSLADVQRLADRHEVDVVYLGCNSGAEAPVGANREFNPVFAIKQLESAILSKDLLGFVSRLTSPSLGIALDDVAFSSFLESPKSAVFTGVEREPGQRFERIKFTRAAEVGLVGLYFGSHSSGDDSGDRADDSNDGASASSLLFGGVLGIIAVSVLVFLWRVSFADA